MQNNCEIYFCVSELISYLCTQQIKERAPAFGADTHFLFSCEKANMKEFVISEAKTETAVLVGLITPNQNEAKTTEYLDELEFLADTAGAKVLKRFTQRVNGPSSVTYVGTGKLEEIRAYIEECEDHVENEDVHPDGTP